MHIKCMVTPSEHDLPVCGNPYVCLVSSHSLVLLLWKFQLFSTPGPHSTGLSPTLEKLLPSTHQWNEKALNSNSLTVQHPYLWTNLLLYSTFTFPSGSVSLLPSQDPGNHYYKLSPQPLVTLCILTPSISGQILPLILQQKQKQIIALQILNICSFLPKSNIQQELFTLFAHFLLILTFLLLWPLNRTH